MSFFNVLPKDKKRPVSKIQPEPIILEKEAVKEIQVTVGESVAKAKYGVKSKISPYSEEETNFLPHQRNQLNQNHKNLRKFYHIQVKQPAWH